MRILPLSLVLTVCLFASSVCRANSFTFTPKGSPATTFELDPNNTLDDSALGFSYSQITIFSEGATSSNAQVNFFNPEQLVGSLDFFINDPLVGVVAYYKGLKLYEGFPGPITFLEGTYNLEAATDYNSVATGTLTIGPSTAPTPEPASVVLLATGLATSAGILRRRSTK